MPKKIQILDAIPSLATAPIFYCSTHGAYSFPWVSVPMTVPPNTIIIETAPIQYLCYFVNLLDIIRPLLTDRRRLLKYLDGQPSKANRATGQKHKILEALSNFIIYLPGSQIVERLLTIGSGRRQEAYGTISERRVYGDMRFTKFFANQKGNSAHEPIEVLKDVRAQLMASHTASETYSSLLAKLDADPHGDPGQPRILIFPNCGEVIAPHNHAAEIGMVEEIQQKARLRWMALQTKTLNALMKNYTKELPVSAAAAAAGAVAAPDAGGGGGGGGAAAPSQPVIPQGYLTYRPHPSTRSAAAAAAAPQPEVFAGEILKNPKGHGEFIVPQAEHLMVEQENDEYYAALRVPPQNAKKSLPPGVKPVFIAETIGGASGGHTKYTWVGNYTKTDINSMLQAGNVLYEFVNGDPTRLTIMHGGGASHKSRRKRRARAGKKTKRYSIFTK